MKIKILKNSAHRKVINTVPNDDEFQFIDMRQGDQTRSKRTDVGQADMGDTSVPKTQKRRDSTGEYLDPGNLFSDEDAGEEERRRLAYHKKVK
jgi:hypothetical protein